MSRRHRGKLAPFIAMDRHQHKSAAFAALSAVAQALLMHLTYNYNTKMMNSVYLSARDGAKKLNMSKNTAARALLELEHYGFIVKLTGAHLGVSGVGKSAHYRLTAQPYGNLGITRDYDKWTGEIFSPKKQNPVPPQGQCAPPQVHKGRAGKPPKMEQASHHRYIGTVTDCPTTGTYLVSPDAVLEAGLKGRCQKWNTPAVEELPWSDYWQRIHGELHKHNASATLAVSLSAPHGAVARETAGATLKPIAVSPYLAQNINRKWKQ
jgi:DNA-binding transcriptional regulator YhcF (GntR family)